jgi:phycocyanin-associated rod linker protein
MAIQDSGHIFLIQYCLGAKQMTSSIAARQLGFEAVRGTRPVELRKNRLESDVQATIFAAYRQIFGNDHILQSERINSAESLLRQGDISVKDFVRTLAQSELYRQKFFSSTPQVRFIELNFKHLLGRAPYDESEITEHVNRYVHEGYEAEINSYFESREYQENFGDDIVPYLRGFETQNGQVTAGFSRMFQLYRGRANSDRAQGKNKSAWLTQELAGNTASPVRTATFGGKSLAGNTRGDRSQLYRVRVMQSARGQAPQVRRTVQEYLVSFEQLTANLQRMNQRGCRVIDVSPA